MRKRSAGEDHHVISKDGQNNPRRKSTTKKQGPTCSSASQVDPSSTQAAPVDQTSNQMLADLDIDAFVSNLIDDSGIGSGQQQQGTPPVYEIAINQL
nr:hypothetical protein Iba_chr15eCG6540 [Ipomoea batatas]